MTEHAEANPGGPGRLAGSPTLIESIWPAQKISKESEAERLSVAGQTLTGLGGYWKGRKPLILNRACILGALLPATSNPERDLEVFESLMLIDDEGFVERDDGRRPHRYGEMAERHGIIRDVRDAFVVRDEQGHESPFDPTGVETSASLGRRMLWRPDLRAGDWRKVAAHILSAVPYEEKVASSVRPEYLGGDFGPAADAWARINEHLGTSANSIRELVAQLGEARFSHLPRIGDSFSGSGQIPYEALRVGCDSYASDQNPIAALLTWSSFELAGSSPERLASLVEELARIERFVEDDVAVFETRADGDRAKAYLYCLEVTCPDTGYRVPLAPNWIISPKRRTIGRLVADHDAKRIDVEIVEGADDELMREAARGTVEGENVVFQLNGEIHRFSLARLRGARGTQSLLRRWTDDEISPRSDDVLRERLYCIQWASAASVEDARQSIRYAAPDADDLARELSVAAAVNAELPSLRARGLVPDMPIDPGLKTDDPIRTRGWTNWIHLFHPRQILMMARLHARIKASPHAAELYYFMPRALDNSSRLNRWKSSQGGGLGGVVGTFDNQALNTLLNFAVRGSIGLRSLVAGPARSTRLDGPHHIDTRPASEVDVERDIWITDPPYADAVVYHELTEFFISWLRKDPPAPFDRWTWDSRRPLAIQGEGDDFRRKMVDTYSNLARLMPDDGLQIVMFTHTSVSVWADLSLIFWGAGLRVSAAWYIATETGSNAPGKRGVGLVQGTVILVLRKRIEAASGWEDEIVQEVRAEVARQIDTMVGINQAVKGDGRIENLFEDSDLQMAGYAAALRVLTGYTRIDGRDMTTEALRGRRKGEASLADRMIDYAVSVANEHLVPEGIDPRLWSQLTGAERFYLKMLGIEAAGVHRLENYQSFARAFRVPDHPAMMASMRPTAARLATSSDFGERSGFEIPDFGEGIVRATLFAIDALTRDVVPETVLLQLRDRVPDYYRRRSDAIAVAEHVARCRTRSAPEGRNAAVLASLLRNERM